MHKQKPKNKRTYKSRCYFCKKWSRSKGLYEILTKQAEGMKVVAMAVEPKKRSIIVNRKLPELVKTQVEAVKNISKLIKCRVQGTMATNGAGSAAFVSGMMNTTIE
jgi:flotillin